MPYLMTVSESSVFVPGKYKSPEGHTKCVEFVRQVTTAPSTKNWKRGIHVLDAKPGMIQSGATIATFDEHGHYPMDGLGKHAAIYLSHNALGIQVLDQWAIQGAVKQRTIRTNNHKSKSQRSRRDLLCY